MIRLGQEHPLDKEVAMKEWWRKWNFFLVLGTLVLAIVALLVVWGYLVPTKSDEGNASQCTQRLTYTQDKKTGLCFASCSTGGGFFAAESITTTNVPCTEAVLRQISAAKR